MSVKKELIKKKMVELGFFVGNTEEEFLNAVLSSLWSLETLKSQIIKEHVDEPVVRPSV